MPPLRGIDRGLNGKALKALEESGHGQRIVIVDPSYRIPRDALTIDYAGAPQTPAALRGILSLLPIDGAVTLMRPDEGVDDRKALDKMIEELDRLGIDNDTLPREDEDAQDGRGFYTIANNPNHDPIFFRTRDARTYACATFLVGHAQLHDNDSFAGIDSGVF